MKSCGTAVYRKNPDIPLDFSPPNSLYLYLVDNQIWMTIQQCVYHTDIWSVDELKKQLIRAWFSLDQDIIDSAIDQWFKRLCICAKGTHFK